MLTAKLVVWALVLSSLIFSNLVLQNFASSALLAVGKVMLWLRVTTWL